MTREQIIHTYPTADDTHVTNGLKCWCHPECEYMEDVDTGEINGIIVHHNAPEG